MPERGGEMLQEEEMESVTVQVEWIRGMVAEAVRTEHMGNACERDLRVSP